MSSYNASLFSVDALNAKGSAVGSLYVRNATNVLGASLDTATNIGALVKNKTQLNAKSMLSRENPTNFYKFSLEGNSLKLYFENNTNLNQVGLRVQILNSSGTIVADSSTFASEELQTAYESVTSSDGLKLKSGDYYAKVTFDVTSTRSVNQTYSLALYSGTSFSTSYQTTAKAQTKASQTVLTDNTMTYSLMTAKAYSTNDTHVANASFDTAVTIGWLYENKSALNVVSQMTSVCDEQFYALTLQKGENLKLAFNNKTNTSDLQVQVYDSTGTTLYADSHGTKAQKEAYAKMVSEEGLAAKTGNYIIAVSYAAGAKKSDQDYNFTVYSGNLYEDLYKTTVATETAATAILSGHFSDLNPQAAAASYMATKMMDNMDNPILYYIYQKWT